MTRGEGEADSCCCCATCRQSARTLRLLGWIRIASFSPAGEDVRRVMKFRELVVQSVERWHRACDVRRERHGFAPCPRTDVLYNTIITLYYTLFALILGLLVLRKEDKDPWRRALID